MALGSNEQVVWERCLDDLQTPNELDDIEWAARDCRMVANLKAIYEDDITAQARFSTICEVILDDYMLEPDELLAAIEIAEDRIINDQAWLLWSSGDW